MKDTLGHDEIVTLLTELGEMLAEAGERAELFLVGGAAMALAYNTRRFTADLGALFEPKSVVYEAARKVAERHGLNRDWLNDAMKGFLPGEDPNSTVFLNQPGIVVRVASPRYLFAMKAAAARADRDSKDLLALYRINGFQSVEVALDCVTEFCPPNRLSPRTMYFIEQLLS